MPSTFEGLCSILNRKTGGIDTEAGLLKLKETMEICSTMPARCLCLNILKASKGSKELLERFLSEGGWRLLNGWLNDSKSAKNADLVLEILRIFKGLPLRTKILRTTSTPKLIRILTRDSLSTGPCETETTEEVMSLAKILKKEWTESIIKEKQKVNANKADSAGAAIKNSHKSKSQQQQQSTSSNNEVKKRLTTTDGVERKATNKRPGAAERDVPEKKVKKREPAKQQTRVAESHNFMDALMESTAPIPRKTKKAKAKTPTPTPTTIILPSLPLSTTVEKSEGKNSPDYLTLPPRSPKLDKNGNPKKTVRWPENDMLCMVRYFEVDKDERANVNSQSFKDKMMQDHKFERSNSIHDWKCPPELTGLPEPIVERGCKSTEKEDQRERESRVLQSLFLDKNLVPHSPAEPEYEDVEFVVTPIIPFGDVRCLLSTLQRLFFCCFHCLITNVFLQYNFSFKKVCSSVHVLFRRINFPDCEKRYSYCNQVII